MQKLKSLGLVVVVLIAVLSFFTAGSVGLSAIPLDGDKGEKKLTPKEGKSGKVGKS